MKRLLAFTAVFFLLQGCSGTEKEAVKNTVVRYNHLLAEGYRSLNMTPLIQVATQKRATKAYYHMAAMGEARLRMDAYLRSITFAEIRILPQNRSEVRTEEIWDYSCLDIDSGKSLFDNTVTYNLRYVLEKQADRWLVEDITIEKAVEKKSTEDIFRRPKNEALFPGDAGRK